MLFTKNIVIIKKITALIVVINILFIFTSCGLLGGGAGDTSSESDTNPSGGFTAPVVENEITETAETESVTLEPEVVEPPTVIEPVEIGKNLSISGKIDPNSSDLLKLHIEWSALQTSDSATAKLKITVFLDSYAIYVRGRTNCKLVINGESQDFSTDLISYEGNSRNSVELVTREVEILNPADRSVTVDISASYYFGGTYGGATVNWIESSGSVLLEQEGGTVNNPLIPELPDSTDPILN